MCCCMKVSYSPECLQALKFAEKVEAVIKYSSREVRMITEAETPEQHRMITEAETLEQHSLTMYTFTLDHV